MPRARRASTVTSALPAATGRRPVALRVAAGLAALAALSLAAWGLGSTAEAASSAIRGPGPGDPADGIVAVAASMGLALAGWLLVVLLLEWLAAVPGAVGRVADRLARGLAPAALRRGASFLLGTTLAAIGLPSPAAAASVPAPGTDGQPTTAAPRATAPARRAFPDPSFDALTGTRPASPDPSFDAITGTRPASPDPSLDAITGTRPPSPDPSFDAITGTGPASPDPSFDRLADAASGTQGAGALPPIPLLTGWTPTRPRAARTVPDAPVDLISRPPAPNTAALDTVVVRRGDTLWDIAARYLGPGATAADIAAAWPRWHSANRAVIGPDPDLITPGLQLRPPRSASTP
ncbi:MAG TPA: LysM domain-containing protein [Dermatophilaceae bacterium]|nr:LysM domain-containing protein [Dermatophilaceae bacterium]